MGGLGFRPGAPGRRAGKLRRMEVHLNPAEFAALLERLYEREDRLDFRRSGEIYPRSEKVDAYVLSGHAEALLSEEFDGDVWDTLADIDEDAADEAEAWAKIKAFYLDRGNVLLRLGEGEEWIFEEALARRLGLMS
jgi:hypothetical protein